MLFASVLNTFRGDSDAGDNHPFTEDVRRRRIRRDAYDAHRRMLNNAVPYASAGSGRVTTGEALVRVVVSRRLSMLRR